MREHVSQSKKATTASFSIPSLKHRIPGFGLESSQASPQAVPLVQPLHKPLTHDISRIPLRNPQAKLSISQPGDKYEQEADSVAQQVMQRMAQPVNRQSIQPEALPESEELQMKPLANSIRPLQRQEMPEDEEELQMKSLDNSTLQRQEVPEDDEELQMKPMVQRQAGMDAAPDLETSINQARGGGMAMAKNIREPMEQAFGADFSGVKVHTDGQSDQLNRSIQARAFTTGQDVFFRQGEYNPGSRSGQELLAHELTHVVQQTKESIGTVQRVAEGDPQAYTDGWRQIVDDTGDWMAFIANGAVQILVPTTDFAEQIENPVNDMPPQYRNVGCSVCVAAAYMGMTARELSLSFGQRPLAAQQALTAIYRTGGASDLVIRLYTELNIYGADERFDNYAAMQAALTEDPDGPEWTGALAWEGHIVRISGRGNTYQITDPQTGATEVAVPTGVPLIVVTFN